MNTDSTDHEHFQAWVVQGWMEETVIEDSEHFLHVISNAPA